MVLQPSAKVRVQSPRVTEPPPALWSNCVVVGRQAYLSGMTARSPDRQSMLGSNEYEQSVEIFRKMRELLEAAGGSIDDIVQMTIFVTDIKRREDVWRARREAFTGDFPACALVQVGALAQPEVLVEIQSVAHIGCSQTAEAPR